MNFPRDLYTPASLLSLGGSAVAVYLFTNIVAVQMLGWSPVVPGFLFAEALAFVGLAGLPREQFANLPKILLLCSVAFCNGMLVYSQSVTFNTLNHGVPSVKADKATLIPLIDPVPWWPPADQQIAIRQAVADLSAAMAPMTDLAAQLDAPAVIVRDQREASERTLAKSREQHAQLDGQLARALEAERQALEALARVGDAPAREQRVADLQRECAGLESQMGKGSEDARKAAGAAYERCARDLRETRARFEEVRTLIEAARREREALDARLATEVASEREAVATLQKLQALEKMVADARRADEDAGNVVRSRLVANVEQSKAKLKEATEQLRRAYVPLAPFARR